MVKYNYTSVNSFRTYPIPADEVFEQEIDINTNVQTIDGYTVKVC
jgi:hypothetical protein